MNIEKKFYLEVKDAIKKFSQYAIDGIKNKTDIEFSDVKLDYEKIRELNLSDKDLHSLQRIIEDSIIGTIHSIFVSIDGGTALSGEKGAGEKALELIDRQTGKPLTDGALHENFMDVL